MHGGATFGVWTSSTTNPKDREVFLFFGGSRTEPRPMLDGTDPIKEGKNR